MTTVAGSRYVRADPVGEHMEELHRVSGTCFVLVIFGLLHIYR